MISVGSGLLNDTSMRTINQSYFGTEFDKSYTGNQRESTIPVKTQYGLKKRVKPGKNQINLK